MKKVFFTILLVLAIVLTVSAPAFASQGDIFVFIDGKKIDFDVNPIITNGRTLVPMRKIFESLGYTVDWNGGSQQITAVRSDSTIKMWIDNLQASVNDKTVTLDVAPVIINGRTLVPLRFVGEASGANVNWNGNTRTINISIIEKDPPPPSGGSGIGSATTGVIDGDVYYKNIEVSRIFVEPLDKTVGNPISKEGPNYFYDGLEIYYTDYVDVINSTNLSLYKLNGITLDKTRAELIAAFGNPIEYFEYQDYTYRASDDNRLMRYHISNDRFDYMLNFWFENTNEKSYSIGIMRMGQ